MFRFSRLKWALGENLSGFNCVLSRHCDKFAPELRWSMTIFIKTDIGERCITLSGIFPSYIQVVKGTYMSKRHKLCSANVHLELKCLCLPLYAKNFGHTLFVVFRSYIHGRRHTKTNIFIHCFLWRSFILSSDAKLKKQHVPRARKR